MNTRVNPEPEANPKKFKKYRKKSRICPECDEYFKTRRDFINHLISRLQQKSLAKRLHNQNQKTCPVCKNTFYGKWNFIYHLIYHLVDKILLENTPKKIPTPLKKPQRKTTPKSKPKTLNRKRFCDSPTKYGSRWVCYFCSTFWPNESGLRDHIAKHTGEKPFSCAKCKEEFSRICHLNIHMERNH